MMFGTLAGVLMVFAYLVAPAIVALAASDRWSTRLAIAWLLGLLASASGLAASFRWDLSPAAPPSSAPWVCSWCSMQDGVGWRA